MDLQLFTLRLKEVFTELNLSNASFAESINVPRSTISHIMSGRNKPSLDFILKIIDTYPDIELNWLLGLENKRNSEEIKLPEQNKNTETIQSHDLNLFTSSSDTKDIEDQKTQIDFNNLDKYEKENSELGNCNTQKNIKKIVFFYDDNSFEVFNP